jgi:ribonuclease Z
MPSPFMPHLVNGPFEDPGLFIPFPFSRRALLFDLGDISRLSPRDLLKISHAFVTHTHMDHFIGFDRLLRCFLGREKELFLFGPAGFIRNVEGKLAGYSWDLVQRFTNRFCLHLTEVHPERLLSRSYLCRQRFAPEAEIVSRPFEGLLHTEPAFDVSAVLLRHSIPCLAFALTERIHVNILKTGLTTLGLRPGPWLARFKSALYDEADPDAVVETDETDGSPAQRFALGELRERIARITPGQKIVYVTDVGDTPFNRAAIVEFARGANILFIEAAFLHSEHDLAAAKHHLTARQAGQIAALAHAKHFTLFHFSPRYEGRAEALLAEAQQAYEETAGGSTGP